MLSLDLGVFNKGNHKVSFREAGIWTGVWVLCALGFYTFLLHWGHLIHGVNDATGLLHIKEHYSDGFIILPGNLAASLQNYRDLISLEFITGYLIEYSLSVDNILVIILIFSSFKVKEEYYKKVLFWGILGAIVMRCIFIFAGSALIHHFAWTLYVFGGILIFAGLKFFFSKDDDDEIDTENHPVVRFTSKYFAVYPSFVGANFWTRQNGKRMMTPLFLVLIIIEFTDLIFAFDSVPAVFSITRDPYVVFFSNIFAILGLRSMFFFLANIMHLFRFLQLGLAFLMLFIGGKMIFHHYMDELGFETSHSLIVIASILVISIAASLLIPEKKKTDTESGS